jgi:DNA-binding transcriptional ArsR family regulator
MRMSIGGGPDNTEALLLYLAREVIHACRTLMLFGGIMPSKSATSDEQSLSSLCQLFRLLSDKTRLQIVMLLAAGERNVTSLCEELDLPQPTVSHHLGLLRMNRVIVNKRQGKQVIYALDNSGGKASNGKLKFSTPPYGVVVEGY